MSLKIAIVVPPVRKNTSFYPPFGALSIIAAAEKEGHETCLLDFDADRCDCTTTVKKIVDTHPDVLGISAIVSTSYKYVKKVSRAVREQLPYVIIVVGGGLSAAGKIVLENTDVDILVHGEGERTFTYVLNALEEKKELDEIEGISFLKKGKYIRTEDRVLIRNLDKLPFPDYDRLNLDHYIKDIHEFIKGFADKKKIDPRVLDTKRSSKFMRIIVSRGCVNQCTFCYRNMTGLRIHSMKYIGDLIEHIIEKYHIGHLSFGDECFGPSKKWLWEFVQMVKERKFDLTYFVAGMRVDIVDIDILRALKEIGFWHIQFGFESGSQKILNIMEKNTTVEQNIEVCKMVERVGIHTFPFLIIGYPGETTETIAETLRFLKEANLSSGASRPSLPMALPGSPLYEYARLKGYIDNEEKYLLAINNTDAGGLSKENYFINYTDSPDHVVMGWMEIFKERNNVVLKIKNITRLIKEFRLRAQEIGIFFAFLRGLKFVMRRFVSMGNAIFVKNALQNKPRNVPRAPQERRESLEGDPAGETLRVVIKHLKNEKDKETIISQGGMPAK